MENIVQLCGKYRVMQMIVVVLGVKFLSVTIVYNYWFQTKSIAYSVKMNCFDTLHGTLP